MVFTVAQCIAFFCDADQMGLSQRTHDKIEAEEGITSIEILGEFEKSTIDHMIANLRRPGEESPILIQVHPTVLRLLNHHMLSVVFHKVDLQSLRS